MPPRAKAQPHTGLMLRLPPDLHDQVRQAADQAGLTVNEWAARAFRWILSTGGQDDTGR